MKSFLSGDIYTAIRIGEHVFLANECLRIRGADSLCDTLFSFKPSRCAGKISHVTEQRNEDGFPVN
jgi:hypothetical protein